VVTTGFGAVVRGAGLVVEGLTVSVACVAGRGAPLLAFSLRGDAEVDEELVFCAMTIGAPGIRQQTRGTIILSFIIASLSRRGSIDQVFLEPGLATILTVRSDLRPINDDATKKQQGKPPTLGRS